MISNRNLICHLFLFVNFLLALVQSFNDDSIEQCGSGFRLNLKFLSDPEAKCADGSPGGYYKSENKSDLVLENIPNRSFIIMLGDTQTCAGESCTELCEGSQKAAAGTGVCNGIGDIDSIDFSDLDQTNLRCLASRAICTSSWWDLAKTLPESTILCEDDSVFGQFKRVFLPSCSLDYWLGNENASTIEPGSFSDTLFRGNTIFESIISELILEENLTFAPKIILAGQRGSGISVLHQMNNLRRLLTANLTESFPGLPVPEIFGIVDSSWIVSVEKFAAIEEGILDASEIFTLDTAYRVNSSDWIERATLLQSCKNKFDVDHRYKCLFPSEVARFHLNNAENGASQSNRVLFIQSQYDLFQLQDLGILSATAEAAFEDTAAYAQGILNFVENFGQQVRNSIEEVVKEVAEGEVGFFTPACGENGYLVPSRFHSIDATVQKLGDAGSILFERDEKAWKTIQLKNQNVRSTIVNFINQDDLEESLLDSCGEFLCNSECITKVFPFALTPLVSLCVQQLVLVYAFLLLFALIFFFFLSYVQVVQWRSSCERFWNMTKVIEEKKPAYVEKKFEVVGKVGESEDEELQFLRNLAIQQSQTADEVQEQLIIETNADSQYRRVHLMCEHLSYWVEPKARSFRSRIFGANQSNSEPGKQLIRNVSIAFEPGKVHALMGPSGSGKTTLLDLISLSKTTGRISGRRYINGVSVNAKVGEFMKTWLKHNQSYVSQQDSFFPSLTVREHLEHCAWMILPEYMSDETKLNRIWQLIRLLDLSSCADTLCGDGGVNVEGGISGGQRRRLSVATQLLLNPCALFLDEPTSGLDSVSALNLVRRLKRFAEKAGVNVILTIHQPRREIYQYLDRMYILVKGTLVFAGDVKSTAEFFQLDMRNERLNVGNEILDILKDKNDPDAPEIIDLTNRFVSSEHFLQIQKEIELERNDNLSEEVASQVREVLVFNSLAEGRHSWRSPSSMFYLQWVLISRTLKRGGFNIVLTVSLALCAGLILGGLFFDSDSYSSLTGLAYLMVSTLTFLQGVFLGRRYFDEKEMFDYEKKAGTLRSWEAFLFAQFSRDAVTSVAESLSFALPAYVLGGFSLEADRLLNFIVLAMLIGYATTSQNVLIQIDRNKARAAATVQIGLLALGALFNGFIVKLDDLPPYYSWIPYVMLNFYGFVGVLINEFAAFSLPCDLSVLECAARTGDVVLQTLQYDKLDVFICALALILLILLTRAAAILDFYVRYVRGGHLTKVGKDGLPTVGQTREHAVISPQATAALLNPAQTIMKVIESQKTSKLAQTIHNDSATAALSKSKKFDPNNTTESKKFEPVATAAGSDPKKVDAIPSLSSKRFDANQPSPQPNLNGVPEISSKKFEKAGSKKKLDDDIDEYDRFEDDEELERSVDEEEQDEENESEPEDKLEQSGYSSILLSREFLVVLFALDLFSAGYICALNSDTKTLLVVVSALFLSAYGIQFFYQLANFMPYTLERSHRDFVWAADVDGPSLILLLIDICFVFLQFGVGDDSGVRQIMTLTIRVVRLIRVQLYFYKGSKAHRIRAQSFLNAKSLIVQEYIAKLNEDAALEAAEHQKKRKNQKKAVPMNWFKSVQITEKQRSSLEQQRNAALRVSSSGANEPKPVRPPRPTRPEHRSLGVNLATLGRKRKNSVTTGSGSHRKSNHLSTGHNALVNKQLQKYQNVIGVAPGTQIKKKPSTNQQQAETQHSNNQPAVPRRPSRESVKNIYTAANGWHKYKNDKTGQIIYYNTQSGKWVDVKEVEQGNLF